MTRTLYATAADTTDPPTPTRPRGIRPPPCSHRTTRHRQGPCTQADRASHSRARAPLGL